MWKCLINSEELITFEKIKSNMRVRIEARYSESLWEIYKTYHSISGDISFTEEYEAPNRKKAMNIISKIKREILDEKKIKNIESLRKNLNLKVKRIYKELTVEKWSFSVNKEEFNNIIIIRYSNDIEMDILADEKYKYVETEIIDELNKTLGLNEFGKDIIQNIYFFSTKSAFYTCDDQKPDTNGKIELDLQFQKEE